jgi:hypothetical protein
VREKYIKSKSKVEKYGFKKSSYPIALFGEKH